MSKSKIAIFGLGKKAFDVLCSVRAQHVKHIELVVIGRDSAVANDYSWEIIRFCQTNNIDFIERHDATNYLSKFTGYKIAIGWRWIINDVNELIVFHDSLLPQYRGFAPVVNSLINGETKLGATAVFASHEYDKGEVITQKSVYIEYPIKIEKAIDIVSRLYTELFDEVLEQITEGHRLISHSQDEHRATYSLWRDSQDYFIDWDRSANEIKRFIDAVGYPYSGALSNFEDQVIGINDAEVLDDVLIYDRKNAIGKVIFIKDGFPVVVCGYGLLKIVSANDRNGKTIIPLKKFRSRFY